MYFTNINDSELSQYHNKVENNFSRALQSILDEDEPNLFKVEDINGDIFKIYPLFYCREISSSNKNDRIIENKCIICENNENTRLNFITPTDQISIEDIGFNSGIANIGNNVIKVYNPTFVFYSKKDRRALENVKLTTNIRDDYWGYVFLEEGYSNSDGLVYLPNLLKKSLLTFGTGTIEIEFNGERKIIWEKS